MYTDTKFGFLIFVYNCTDYIYLMIDWGECRQPTPLYISAVPAPSPFSPNWIAAYTISLENLWSVYIALVFIFYINFIR